MQKKTTKRLAMAASATAVALVGGELLYRAVRPEPTVGMYFRDAERHAVGLDPTRQDEILRFRLQIQVPWPDPALPAGVPTVPAPGEHADWFGTGYAMPRQSLDKNVTWRPGARFYICYQGPRRDYFDEDGCVEYRFNRFGIRDREDLTLLKPAGSRRVVCLGDSLTLGWGVRQQANWPVLVEQRLQQRWPAARVQVVNCGGAGSSYADEYELALRHRFGRFDPDVVLVSLCLNDLVITNGKLCHYATAALREGDLPQDARRWWMASRLLFDLSRGLAADEALRLDPDRDWVQRLIDLPGDHVWYRNKGETPAVYWRGGAPQRALAGMQEWCTSNGCKLAVVVWPLLQGLSAGARYPFGRLHRMVAELCARRGVPFCDLLPVLQGHPDQELWVSPHDMHPNELAQQLVEPRLSAFVADVLELE